MHDSPDEPVVLVSLDIIVVALEVGGGIGANLSESHGRFWNKCGLIRGASIGEHAELYLHDSITDGNETTKSLGSDQVMVYVWL